MVSWGVTVLSLDSSARYRNWNYRARQKWHIFTFKFFSFPDSVFYQYSVFEAKVPKIDRQTSAPGLNCSGLCVATTRSQVLISTWHQEVSGRCQVAPESWIHIYISRYVLPSGIILSCPSREVYGYFYHTYDAYSTYLRYGTRTHMIFRDKGPYLL